MGKGGGGGGGEPTTFCCPGQPTRRLSEPGKQAERAAASSIRAAKALKDGSLLAACLRPACGLLRMLLLPVWLKGCRG